METALEGDGKKWRCPFGLSLQTNGRDGLVRVRAVESGSPAAKAGLKAGDVVAGLGLTREDLLSRDLTDARAFLASHAPGVQVLASLRRAKGGRPKTASPKNLKKQLSTEAERKREAWAEATPEKRSEKSLRDQQWREQQGQERWDSERERKYEEWAAKSPEEKAAYSARVAQTQRESRSKALAEEKAKARRLGGHHKPTHASSTNPFSKVPYADGGDPSGRPRPRINRFPTANRAYLLASYQDPQNNRIRSNLYQVKVIGKARPGTVDVTRVVCGQVPFMLSSAGQAGQERPLLDYDGATAREVLAQGDALTQDLHDEMLTPPGPIEAPVSAPPSHSCDGVTEKLVEVVTGIMDWVGELLGWREDVVYLPTAIFSMGGPTPMPRLPPQPVRGYPNPCTLIATVYIGSGYLGHYVTLAVLLPGDAGEKNVNVFDSLQSFTLGSGNTQLYQDHLAKVGATMLGLDSTEGVKLLFHDLHQQSAGNSCAAFAMLYSVALAFFVLPHDLRVSEVQEIALRRRLHDFYFCTAQDGTPSLTPLRRALEAATNLFHDDEDTVQVPCPMCPDGQARALDLSIASADCSITQLSLSDHEDPDPPPLATSSPPPPKRKAPSQSKTLPQSARKKKVTRTERVRAVKRKVELDSAFLPPLKRRGVAPEEESLCPFCESFLLAGEAGSESEVKSKWCCSQGALVAPKLQAFEADFYQEGRYILPAFRDAARKLNGMAAMASSGVSGKWVTFGGGTSYVKVQGRTYHKLHNLGDPGTRRPNQMCILSPDFQKLHSRSLNVNPELTARVFEFLHRTNPLYATYRRLDGMASTSASLLFQKTTRKTHGHVLGDAPGRQHNLMPQAEEITAVISTDAEAAPRDVRVWAKGDVGPKTLSPLDPAYEALSYPLLRPAADASWDLQMVGPPQEDGKRRKITQLQYQRQMHLSQSRMWEVGRLGQEALVDAFCRIESARLNWVRSNQATLRMGTREEVARQMGEEADPSILAGRQIILPASFTNSPRQMRQLYHDAMCVVAAKGKPTFFITVTCNPKWAEIAGAEEEEVEEAAAEAGRLEGLPASRKRKTPAPKGPSAKVSRRPTNCPSITARVFKLKLALLMHDVRSGRVFGSQTVYSMECIEFQKRGLPHAHIIVRLVEDVPMDQIDDHISARLPGPDQPDLRAKVLRHMIHGPCGVGVNPGSPCMMDGRCSKRYPMGMEETTRLDERGFPHYRRTAEHSAVIRRAGRDLAVNDSFVVPHSPALLQKYDCHINVEYASTPRTVKYLFKYVLKGPDRAKAVLSEAGREVDEVQDYESQRMIGACEAAWRIFGFELHSRSISVICLTVHEEDLDQHGFHPDHPAAALTKTTKLMRYFNRPHGPAFDGLTFCQLYEQHIEGVKPTTKKVDGVEVVVSVPHPDGVHHLKPRERGELLCRLNWVSTGMTELFYLRLILAEFAARSFRAVRTVAGVVHATFCEAAKALGLADDEMEFFKAIEEAAAFLTPYSLRSFFVTLLMGEKTTPAPRLWKEFADLFAKDWLDRLVPQDLAHTNALLHISRLLSLHLRTLGGFGLPEVEDPDTELARELSRFPPEESQAYVERWKELFTDEQRVMIDAVLLRFDERFRVAWPNQTAEHTAVVADLRAQSASIRFAHHETLLLLAAGGCGKTAALKFLAHHLRLLGEVVVCCASTGIAATNLPGGITAHSAFKLPFDNTDPDGTSSLSMMSERADLLRRASLIVYDEVAMAPRNTYRAFQRFLADLRSPRLRVVLLCGDYAQIPPVVKHGSKRDILQASTRFIPEWPTFPVLRLTKNMRAATDPEYSAMTRAVGQGTLPTVRLNGSRTPLTPLPLIQTLDSREDLIAFVYPDLRDPYQCIKRAILSGTNVAIDAWNEEILRRLPGQEEIFLSADSGTEEGTTDALQMSADTLAAFSDNGVPPHRLTLKIGASVMIMRNLNFDAALCNSVKGIVRGFSPSRKIVYVEVPREDEAPEAEPRLHAIPRISFIFSPAGKGMEIRRRQFPLRLAYALTFNKSQGQTLERAGVDLTSDVFAHGQLYVVVSRVRERGSIRALTREERVEGGVLHAFNVVYPELVGEEGEAEAESPPSSRASTPEFHGGAFPDDHDEEEL